MTVINSDVAVKCPYCERESNKMIGEVWYESETIKRQWCKHCDRYYFSAMSLTISVETYKIQEADDAA